MLTEKTLLQHTIKTTITQLSLTANAFLLLFIVTSYYDFAVVGFWWSVAVAMIGIVIINTRGHFILKGIIRKNQQESV